LKILIYALGGGWGHLTRAVALARALVDSTQVNILSNSPYLRIVQGAVPKFSIVPITTREEAGNEVQGDWDLLVVDTFPRGLGGELADLLPALKRPKVLIHRVLNPDYIARASLRSFVSDNYDCVLCPGERGAFADLPQAIFTAPWLFREPVPVSPGRDVVICAGGNAWELEWYGEAAALLSGICETRCIAAELPPGCPPEAWIRHWPSIDWIASAKVVIGGAGYNTVQECLATGVPLIARPWPRKYDLQRWRVEQHPRIRVVTTPQEAASAALDTLREPARAHPHFTNGANEAAAIILSLV
jgi:predicted glycosyltransferase